MFLKKKKKRRFLFSFYFWKQKRLKTTKKRSKEELKKKKSTKHKRDFWWESVSFVFLCYMGLKHNTTMFRTPLKRELLLKRELQWQKKRLTEKWKQLRRRCILPCTFLFFSFFFCGGQRVQEPARAHDALVGAGCGAFLIPRTLPSLGPSPFLSLSPSLSRPVSLTL